MTTDDDRLARGRALLAQMHGARGEAAMASLQDIAPDLAAVRSIRFLTTADFPPFNYRDRTGALIGYNVDLAKGICGELKVTCTIQAWPWEQAPKALQDNQGDALIAGLTAVLPEGPGTSGVMF